MNPMDSFEREEGSGLMNLVVGHMYKAKGVGDKFFVGLHPKPVGGS